MRATLGRHSKGKSVAAVNTGDESANWKPVDVSERYTILDLLRGIALFGVLLFNLLYFFRLSLFDHILNSTRTPAGQIMRLTCW